MKSIIVYSGKGGVGKTTTSANIAKTLSAQGNKVYIIDADINTPSMGVIFGSEHPADNIWVASTSFLYKNMIYMENAMVRNYLRDCIKKINTVKPDYVIVDTPPSITDVHINLLEVIKVSAIVIVTQPNELSRTDVSRTARFFTEKCPEAGCVIVENMCKEDNGFKYPWRLLERIPFVEGFDGRQAYELYADKYKHVVEQLETLDMAEVRFEAQKRMMFDETITVDDLPYFDDSQDWVRFAKGSKSSEIKFVNINTWDYIADKLQDMQEFAGRPDAFLDECTAERIKRLLSAFEEDDEAYFMVTRAPQTEIKLMPGEIGKASLFVDDSYYGVPRIKYKTRQGEIVLFPYEVMPATMKHIQENLEDGGILVSDGRYIPKKETMEEVYEAYGHRVGMNKNWAEAYDRILDQNIDKEKSVEPVKNAFTHRVKQKHKRQNKYHELN